MSTQHCNLNFNNNIVQYSYPMSVFVLTRKFGINPLAGNGGNLSKGGFCKISPTV